MCLRIYQGWNIYINIQLMLQATATVTRNYVNKPDSPVINGVISTVTINQEIA